jgi:CheY-like chemotaxis protein
MKIEQPIAIVAMTANATPDGKQRCLEAGMDYFLSKPVAAGRLFDLIERISSNAPVCQ